VDWEQYSYNGEAVWVRVDDEGEPIRNDGMVPMKRNLDQSQTWRVKSENISPMPEVVHEAHPPDPDTTEIYTDGSSLDSSQQGGPTGVGIVIRNSEKYSERSEPAGRGNNITAELEAILLALKTIDDGTRTIRLYTDSEYAVKSLTDWIDNWRENNWKTSSGDPVSNQDLLKEISSLMEKFDDLELEWVEGHSGHPFNDRADTLAARAAEESSVS